MIVIHIAYCFDENYQRHFAASLTSLLANYGGSPSELVIHAVTTSVSPQLPQFQSAIERLYKTKVQLHVLDEVALGPVAAVPDQVTSQNPFLNRAAYLRLLLPSVLAPEIERVLYFDSDTIVLGDVRELAAFDLSGHPAGAAADIKQAEMAAELGLSGYVNSGVMVIDLAQWRSQQIAARCFDYLARPGAKARFADQCAINAVLDGQIAVLPPRWNVCVGNVPRSEAQVRDARQDASVLHFITGNKPWHPWYNNDLSSYYWAYQRASPWPDDFPAAAATVDQMFKAGKKARHEGKMEAAASYFERVALHLIEKRNVKID